MKNFVESFKSVLESSEQIFRSINDEQSSKRLSPSKWSSKEILGHLIDSSINNIRRLVLSQIQEDLIFSGYQQDDWVRIQNYHYRDWNFLIDLWKLNNIHLINIVEAIPGDLLTKEFEDHNFDQILSESFAPDKPVTIEILIRDYLSHMKHHIDQILKLNSI